MAGVRRGLAAGLLVATLIAGALRFSSLGAVPVSLYCDEAFHGYEAWSLLETGRDSRGVPLPFFFDIFGKGWGEPLYIYLTVPAVWMLGLTPAACRFVAALAGTLAVPLTGLMTASLLSSRRSPPPGDRLAGPAGVAAAFLMAISPWSFHLSRVGFQASLLPPLLAAGFWLAARSLPDLPRGRLHLSGRSLAAAGVALGLCLYTYTVSRLEMPLLVGGFAWFFRRELKASPRVALIALLIVALLAIPIFGFSLTERGRQRFSDVSILSAPDVERSGLGGTVIRVAGNYLSYYSPAFLLTDGDPNLRHSIRGHGILHPHDLILLVVGALVCVAGGGGGGGFLLWWLAVFPAAASLTIDPRHAVRAICGQPGLYALAGVGAAWMWGMLRAQTAPARLWLARAGVAVALTAALLSTGRYFRDYFIEYPVYSGPWWQYGLKETYDYTESVAAGHDSIYITRNEDYPWIHLLFYRAIDPRQYQAHRLTRTPYLFDQEVFYKGARIPNRANPIFVWKPDEVPEAGVEVRKVIKYPDGSDAFVIAW
jgi:4-amino-4-deoxy-L-arabinose transferase-like glycosyltransferase